MSNNNLVTIQKLMYIAIYPAKGIVFCFLKKPINKCKSREIIIAEIKNIIYDLVSNKGLIEIK